MEDNVLRENPEDANKTPQEKRRLQKSDAKVSCQLGQVAGVLVDALIRISAHLTGIDQVKGTHVLKPLVEQVTN
jgi:hypothetical protein